MYIARWKRCDRWGMYEKQRRTVAEVFLVFWFLFHAWLAPSPLSFLCAENRDGTQTIRVRLSLTRTHAHVQAHAHAHAHAHTQQKTQRNKAHVCSYGALFKWTCGWSLRGNCAPTARTVRAARNEHVYFPSSFCHLHYHECLTYWNTLVCCVTDVHIRKSLADTKLVSEWVVFSLVHADTVAFWYIAGESRKKETQFSFSAKHWHKNVMVCPRWKKEKKKLNFLFPPNKKLFSWFEIRNSISSRRNSHQTYFSRNIMSFIPAVSRSVRLLLNWF